jgi:hypothetical protein
MTLYEIDNSIADLLSKLEPDETGLLPENCDELFNQLQNLDMQRKQKLENVAKYVLNVRSEAAAVKAEEQRLASRRKVLENKEKSLMQYLDNACQGQKTDFGVATLSYRKSEKVAVSDYHRAIQFLSSNHYSDCYRTFNPEIAKTEVKALIKSGTQVPGVEIVTGTSCSLR